MVLRKVISGGQNGVDVAALRAAKSLSIETGGRMPLTYRTLAGPRPEYAELFGMTEDESIDYRLRTFANVRDSDATLRIAADFASAGERCTMSAILRHRKPHVDVALVHAAADHWAASALPAEVATWIVEQQVRVLNVAGNSEQTAPGIERFAEEYLRIVFGAIRDLGAVSSPP